MFEGIKLTKDSVIYIVSPMGCRTGGPTLLHQLASTIIKMGGNAEIFYYMAPTSQPYYAYGEYHIKIADEIKDEEQNVIIAAEIATSVIAEFSKIQKVIWWLSVDAFLFNLVLDYTEYLRNKNFDIPLCKKFNFTGSDPIIHFTQSKYALNFLRVNKIEDDRIFWLSDYLQPVFLQRANQIDITKKEKIVAYNPAKGAAFTDKIITFAHNLNPEINFYPIKNMTSEEVKNLLSRAMVYIDFGNHPGKDRIPREAAISGCVVITGKRGAAGNDEDIPIDAEFKFNDDEAEIPNIIKKITEVFDDFPKYHAKFEHYREIIRGEPKKFEEDAVKALNLPNNRTKEFAAILQTGAREKVCRDFIANSPDLELVFVVGEKSEDISSYAEYISMDDALFLYQERRIEKFALVSISDAEKENFIKELTEIGIDEEDLIFIDVRQ